MRREIADRKTGCISSHRDSECDGVDLLFGVEKVLKTRCPGKVMRGIAGVRGIHSCMQLRPE